MFKRSIQLFLFVLLLLAGSCKQSSSKVETSFYHWEHELKLDSVRLHMIERLEVKSLYVRIFDIDYKDKTQEPTFLSPLKKTIQQELRPEIIPCIYITNRSFKGIDKRGVDVLAKKTADYISLVQKRNQIVFSAELQLDCDWTPSTKDNYFHFLTCLKKYLHQFNQYSATIRLHQFKYPIKTGVPPVDKGSLMVYNMGDFENQDASNAIYDNDILKLYLSSPKKYPLHLDVAMPVFSWALVFRFGKAMKIVNQPNLSSLAEEQFEVISKDKYKVTRNGYWSGLYLYEGDVLRVDRVSADEIEKGLELIRDQGVITPNKIIYYQLYNQINQHYSDEDFKKFSAVFN